MKVVLFCGGLGLRMRQHSESLPKPMVSVGSKPILWHVMRYYAHFGHRDFTLCLGYRGDAVKDFFSGERPSFDLVHGDTEDWRIGFADTGLDAPVGQRLLAVRDEIGGDDVFLANYGDVLTDAPLDELIHKFRRSGKMAAFLAVRPTPYTFHLAKLGRGNQVTSLESVSTSDLRINGGYFMFRSEILDWIRPGEDLVPDVFPRLIERGELLAYRYDGFWAPMDTVRDWQTLEAHITRGDAPWAIWQSPPVDVPAPDGRILQAATPVAVGVTGVDAP